MKLFCLAAIATSTVIPDFLGDGVIVNDSLIDAEYPAEVLSTKEGRAFKDDCVNSLSSFHRDAVEACDALVLNNKYRKNHAASDFTVPSKSTCEGAQAWSQYLADKSLAAGKPILEHSSRKIKSALYNPFQRAPSDLEKEKISLGLRGAEAK